MRSSEERVMILRMIEEGKVSAEDGARLLAAMNEAEDAALVNAPSIPVPAANNGNRFLHVRVTDMKTGKRKVSVNIPIALVSFGLRFVPDSAGINVNEVRTAIESGYTGTVVDVYDEEDGEHVEITLE